MHQYQTSLSLITTFEEAAHAYTAKLASKLLRLWNAQAVYTHKKYSQVIIPGAPRLGPARLSKEQIEMWYSQILLIRHLGGHRKVPYYKAGLI